MRFRATIMHTYVRPICALILLTTNKCVENAASIAGVQFAAGCMDSVAM